MIQPDLGRALEVAERAAREAGLILRRDFHRPGGPRGGGDKADADVEAERAIRARLAAAFPEWGFLGEETGASQGRAETPLWVVDPNDGTRDYLAGRRGSAVSIGLLAGRVPCLGVVFAFAYPDDEGELFAWAEGSGAVRRNGRPADARLPVALGPLDVVLLSSSADAEPAHSLGCVAPARYRTVPSIAHRLALAAAGEGTAVVSLNSPQSWDLAGGHALLRGAGGVVCDEAGKEVAYAGDGRIECARAFAGSRPVARVLAARRWDSAGDGEVQLDDGAGRVRLAPGDAVPDAPALARAQGCLLGQVAGDSLGSRFEFRRARDIAREHADGPRRLEDGGVWETLAGQPTDDSEMALALARSIVACGRYDRGAAFEAYREWIRSGPFDVGDTLRAALNDRPNPASQANGSLMRLSPLAVFAHRLPAAAVAELAREDAALTHPSPVCGDAAAAWAVAVAHAVRHGDGPESAYRAAVAWAEGADAALLVRAGLEAARGAPPECDTEGSEGWVRIALQNAFHELLASPSLEEGVVNTVRRGGDTDTNAAVTGALLGAVHGRDAVPRQWREMVLSCRPHPPRAARPRPRRFWPVDVMEISERLLLAGRGQAGPESKEET